MRMLRVLMLVAVTAVLPASAADAQAACAYFESDTGTFYIDLQTGAWRLVWPIDVSGPNVDELRLTGSVGRFAETTESGAQLRGVFHANRPGWVTYQAPGSDRAIRIHDRAVEVAFCN